MSSMDLGRPIRRVPRKAAQTSADVRVRELDDMPSEDQCYYLRCRGYSIRQIATKLQIDKNTVMRRIKKVSASLRPTDEDKLNWLQESIDSFEQVKFAAWERFEESGDPYLLAQVTAAEERIAKIHGLIDTGKTKVEVSGPNGGSIPVEFSARTAFARIAGRSEADS